jgi:predicted nucleotide-binding protein
LFFRSSTSRSIATNGEIFGLGTATIEALEAAAKEYDFALFVFTADDLLKKRESEAYAPRDNVIFEAGLFIGKISRFRAFVVHPRNKGMQIPSDLSGVTMATYDANARNLDAALGPACRQIRLAAQNNPRIAKATSRGGQSRTHQ